MKNTLNFNILLIVGCLLINNGCSKHEDPSVPTPCLLSTITFSASYTTDTIVVASFIYNSNNILSGLGSGFGAPVFSYGKKGQIISGGFFLYKYNSDSTLITSITAPGGFAGYGQNFAYNSSGQLTSAYLGVGIDSINFVYNSKDSKNPLAMNFSTTGAYNWETSIFQYDNAPNPLLDTYKVPALFFNFYPYLSNLNGGSFNGYDTNVPVLFSSNNITKITTTAKQVSNYVTTIDIIYTYNTKGYPVKAVQTVSVNGLDQKLTRTFNFAYTNCQ